MDLDYVEYLLYLRDSYIYTLMKTEEGREYLENCWRLSQTSPDRKSLKEHFGK